MIRISNDSELTGINVGCRTSLFPPVQAAELMERVNLIKSPPDYLIISAGGAQ